MSLLQTMLTHLDSPYCEPSEQASQPTENDISASGSELFVFTDLETAKFEWAVTSASDVEYNGKIYRRLEPEYFAWLQFRMMAAQSAFKAGKLPESTWESLKAGSTRFRNMRPRNSARNLCSRHPVSSARKITKLPAMSRKNLRNLQNLPRTTGFIRQTKLGIV